MSTKAVIFDLDDTLYPEKSYCISGYRAVAEAKGLDFELLRELFEESPGMVFNRYFERLGINYTKDDITGLINIYRNHEPEISFYDEVPEVISGLKERNIKIGILSDGYAVSQRQKVRALECEKYFDAIVLTDEIGRDAWKPSAKGFELLMSEFSVKSDEMLYVGDNPSKDFYVKVTAGVKTARIKREDGVYFKHPYLENVREDYYIESLTDIIELIK